MPEQSWAEAPTDAPRRRGEGQPRPLDQAVLSALSSRIWLPRPSGAGHDPTRGDRSIPRTLRIGRIEPLEPVAGGNFGRMCTGPAGCTLVGPYGAGSMPATPVEAGVGGRLAEEGRPWPGVTRREQVAAARMA